MKITPASIRNNNPGAMYPGKSAKKFGATSHEVLRSKDGVHKIATFPTPVHGAAAQFDLLAASYCGMPIEKAITKWCGAFYVGTYLKVLEEKAGVKRTDTLTKDMLRRPEVGIPLARAMAWQEAGRDFPLDDEGWQDAHAMAFAGDAKAPAFSPDNDVPSPKPETRMAETAKAVTKVAVPAAGVTGAVVQTVTAPPDLTAVTQWKGFGDSIGQLLTWGTSNPGTLVICVVVFVGVTFGLPMLRRS